MSDQEDADEVAVILKGHRRCLECRKYLPLEKMEEQFFPESDCCKECYTKLYGCTIEPDKPWPRGQR
ncbi:hypothetical protein KAR91_18930 [Candidatus Pacearchaeota archaeon]|nr:hypothetical protein [Candidatus Pacearchaeota archaeon]